MYALELDIKITRRQRLCTVRNDDGDLVFTCQQASDAFEWLWEHGIMHFRLDAQDHHGTLNSYFLSLGKGSYATPPK